MGCLLLRNDDDQAYDLTTPANAYLGARGTGRFCFPTFGIQRVQLNGVAYSGGFVIVDQAITP